MNKNTKQDFEVMVAEVTELYGDMPVEMTFREVKEGIDSFFALMGMTVELVNLIREESELKKHHRACEGSCDGTAPKSKYRKICKRLRQDFGLQTDRRRI